jgi:hypothetical protein
LCLTKNDLEWENWLIINTNVKFCDKSRHGIRHVVTLFVTMPLALSHAMLPLKFPAV